MEKEFEIYYKINVIVPDKAKIMLPFREEPISIRKFKKKYNEFAKTFDGTTSDSYLEFFWKYEKTEGIFVFNDGECEDEVAEILNIKIEDCIDEIIKNMDDSKSSKTSALTAEEIEEFHKHLADIHDIHKKVDEKTIEHKKE